MTYGFRILDKRTERQLGASPDLTSPYEVGRMAADAYVVLIGRDGHDPANLDLEGVAFENGQARSFTPAEESAMVSALDQYMADLGAKP